MPRIGTSYHNVFLNITQRAGDTFDLPQPTLADVVRAAEGRYGRRFTESLVDPATWQLKPGMTVLVNGSRVDWHAALSDGDEVSFLAAIAGGCRRVSRGRGSAL